MARGKRKGYTKLLLCKKDQAGVDRIPTVDEYDAAVGSSEEEKKKVVKLGELNELAYEYLIFSINGNMTSGRVAFNLVKNCKRDEYPEGNSKMAWDHLVHKYAP
ncbi:MAG: hypothetical protein GY874_15000 [Desulfobacteraceae bacterium]|nr:hypothetical protein [Desulfobacteraceae bacterium]